MGVRTHTALVALLTMLFVLHQTIAGEPPDEGTDVYAMLIEWDPWRPVGLNSQVVFYTNGTVIVSKVQDDGSVSWTTGNVSAKTLVRVKQALRPTDAFRELKDLYDLQPNGYDLPSVEIVLKDGPAFRSVHVRGLALEDHVPAGAYFGEQTKKPEEMPSEFQRLLNVLSTLKLENVKTWVPEYIEAVIFKVRDHRTLPLDWPEDLPGLKDPLSRMNARGDGCSLFLRRDKLKTYETLDKERAFAIDGQLWRISHSKPVIPGLDDWKRIVGSARRPGARHPANGEAWHR